RRAVDDVHGVALGGRRADDVGAEKARPTDDEDPHAGTGRRAWVRISPASTIAPTPSTTCSSTAPSSTRAPSPRTEWRTVAAGPIDTSGRSTLAHTVAPGATRARLPITLSLISPSTIAPWPTHGSAGPRRRPVTASRLACR